MAPLNKFKVCISNVKCQNLAAKDKGGTSDPYIKFNFDNFKSFETEVIKKNLNPSFQLKQEFYYETRYIQRLREKTLSLDVYDKDIIGRDDFIGACKIDLHTLCTGPVHHELELRDIRKHTGKVILDVEFVIVNDIQLTIKDVQANFDTELKSAYLKYHLLNTKGVEYKTSHCENTKSPSWAEFEQIVFNCPLKDYLMESLVFRVKDQRKDLEHCSGVVPLIDFYKCQNKLTAFKTVLTNPSTKTQVGTIEGFIFVSDLPEYAQMIKGTHTETGIINGEKLMDSLDSPDLYVPSPSRSSVISNSVKTSLENSQQQSPLTQKFSNVSLGSNIPQSNIMSNSSSYSSVNQPNVPYVDSSNQSAYSNINQTQPLQQQQPSYSTMSHQPQYHSLSHSTPPQSIGYPPVTSQYPTIGHQNTQQFPVPNQSSQYPPTSPSASQYPSASPATNKYPTVPSTNSSPSNQYPTQFPGQHYPQQYTATQMPTASAQVNHLQHQYPSTQPQQMPQVQPFLPQHSIANSQGNYTATSSNTASPNTQHNIVPNQQYNTRPPYINQYVQPPGFVPPFPRPTK
eukprot:NODE_410_length_9177_cov_0.515091.p1 type:complete len:568 gc:universal NODE_410_length_9177_cov_0.515091:7723-6020(-)